MKEIPQRAASLHMAEVILWTNGCVSVFDDLGEQMPDYQGRYEVKASLIQSVFTGRWSFGDWKQRIIIRFTF